MLFQGTVQSFFYTEIWLIKKALQNLVWVFYMYRSFEFNSYERSIGIL